MRLDVICTALFVVSTLFPIAAGVYPYETVPRWLGVTDVVIAGLLVVAAIAVAIRHQTRVTDEDRLAAFRISQVVVSCIPALLAIFFLAGQRVNWVVLVVGLAWRGWLLLYTLPFLMAARSRSADLNA